MEGSGQLHYQERYNDYFLPFFLKKAKCRIFLPLLLSNQLNPAVGTSEPQIQPAVPFVIARMSYGPPIGSLSTETCSQQNSILMFRSAPCCDNSQWNQYRLFRGQKSTKIICICWVTLKHAPIVKRHYKSIAMPSTSSLLTGNFGSISWKPFIISIWLAITAYKLSLTHIPLLAKLCNSLGKHAELQLAVSTRVKFYSLLSIPTLLFLFIHPRYISTLHQQAQVFL